ncbi:hypothetical protein Ctob_004844, partial [Chrysochromulina tobinii]
MRNVYASSGGQFDGQDLDERRRATHYTAIKLHAASPRQCGDLSASHRAAPRHPRPAHSHQTSTVIAEDGSHRARGYAGRHGAQGPDAIGHDAGHHPEWPQGRPGVPHDGSRARAPDGAACLWAADGAADGTRDGSSRGCPFPGPTHVPAAAAHVPGAAAADGAADD